MVQLLWRFLKKLKVELSYDLSNPTPGYISRKDKNSNLRRYMHHNVHSSTIYNTIAKTWKQPKCPLTDKWTKKMWYI